jgi:hypothetical protein
MIKSIVVCEDTTNSYEPINAQRRFFPGVHGTVQILVRLSKIEQDSNVTFQWYISGEPETPLATYVVTMIRNSSADRFAVGVLDLEALLVLNSFDIYQKWFVIVSYEGETYREDFELRKFNNYLSNGSYPATQRNTVSATRINWRG